MIDVRWLMIIPFGSMAAFATWVLWNLTREIRAEKRRWVRTYRNSGLRDRGMKGRPVPHRSR